MRDTERNLISSFKRRETAQFVHLAHRENTAGQPADEILLREARVQSQPLTPRTSALLFRHRHDRGVEQLGSSSGS